MGRSSVLGWAITDNTSLEFPPTLCVSQQTLSFHRFKSMHVWWGGFQCAERMQIFHNLPCRPSDAYAICTSLLLLGFDPLCLAKQKNFLRASFFSEFFFLSVYRNVRFFQFILLLNRFTQTFKITEYRKNQGSTSCNECISTSQKLSTAEKGTHRE